MPGGAEGLIHLRRCLEQAADGAGSAAVILDLDLRNAFPSLEWPAVREATGDLIPELAAWTAWCHSRPGAIQLPCGEWIECDRGAEQGDPLGPAYCAVVLIRCAEAGRQAVEQKGGWCWDAWHMDDGQVMLPPDMAAVYLTAFDEALVAAGGTRVAGDTFKSQARLIGSPAARAAVPAAWHAGIVSQTCKVASPAAAAAGKVLGVDLSGETLAEQLRSATTRVDEARRAILGIGDAPAELSLLRMSANVCRIVHLLRAAGPDLGTDALQAFDDAQDECLGALLGGALPSLCAEKAACGASDGGLGLRRARDLQLPAFLASRTEARGLAEELGQTLPSEWQELLFTLWSRTTDAALERWQQELTPPAAAVAAQALEEASAAADARCARFVGRLPPAFDPEAGDALAKRVACALVSPAGLEDPEHPDAPSRQLQHRLADMVAQERIGDIRQRLVDGGGLACGQAAGRPPPPWHGPLLDVGPCRGRRRSGAQRGVR